MEIWIKLDGMKTGNFHLAYKVSFDNWSNFMHLPNQGTDFENRIFEKASIKKVASVEKTAFSRTFTSLLGGFRGRGAGTFWYFLRNPFLADRA